MKSRLLFISPRFLFPLDQGGKIRTANILRGLRGGAFEIVLASPAPPEAARHEADIRGVCDRFLGWTEPRPARWRRVAALLDRLPVAAATDRSAEGRRVVAGALEAGADLVVADFPHADVLLPDRLTVPSVLFTHNVEAEIFERHAQVTRPTMSLLWREQARKMRRFEAAALRRHDCVIAVSARDAHALRTAYGLARVATIDTGVDLDFYAYSPSASAPSCPPDGGTIIFTGRMDWAANVDGIAMLLDEVWPIILARRPAAKAVIVGPNPPAALVARARGQEMNWTFTGFVEDLRPLVAGAHVFVIPLRVGSGTRIKAFEAMAMGRPVVSTAIGVEGLDIVRGTHFLAADTPADFAAAVLRLLDDAALRERLAQAARALVEQRFSWSQVARQFEAICQATIAGPAVS